MIEISNLCNFKTYFSDQYLGVFPVRLSSGECHRTPPMISQHWFRKWLAAVKQQDIRFNIDQVLWCHVTSSGLKELTYLPLDKMATTISQTIFSNDFSWMKSFVFWFKFHWSVFLGVQLKISQHWLKHWCQTGNKPLFKPMLTQFTDT